MKRFIGILLFSILFIIGCAKNTDTELKNNMNEEYDVSEWISLTSKDDLFSMTLFINKLEFKENEKIKLFSTVEYIGERNEIDTWSGRPNFKYVIYDGSDYYCEAMQLDVLEKTTFKKGEVYNYPFQKSGGWSEDDPKADYWKSYYSDTDLKLPKGTYEITAFCDFTFNDTIPFDKYNQEIKFEIIVE